jgi:M6 family metalloprotease-like protein
MQKKLLSILVVFLVSFGSVTVASASIKPGTKCQKVALTKISSGKKFTCIKSGKKLIWNKGVPIKSPAPTPTPTATPTSTPTPTMTAKSLISKCKLPVADGRGDVSIGGWPRIADRMKTTGTVITQVVMVDFPDAPATISPQNAFAMVSGASETFKEMSYGRLDYKLVPTFKWYRMKSNSTTYAPLNKSFDSHRAYIAEALAMADPDIDFSQSDAFLILANPDAAGIGNSGPAFASLYGRGFTLDGKYIANGTTSSYDLNNWKSIWLNHEVTHTMGLVDLYAATASTGSRWDYHRYVGQFSYMGLSSFNSNAPSLTAYERWNLDWLDDQQIVCSDQSEFTQLITPVQTAGGIKAIMLPLSSTKLIVVESRRAIGIDKGIKKTGALVYIVDSIKQSGYGPIQVFPIDLTSDPVYLNSPRALGESVSLEGYTITVTATGLSGDTVSITRKG